MPRIFRRRRDRSNNNNGAAAAAVATAIPAAPSLLTGVGAGVDVGVASSATASIPVARAIPLATPTPTLTSSSLPPMTRRPIIRRLRTTQHQQRQQQRQQQQLQQQQQQRQQPQYTCHGCRQPILRSDRHIHTSRSLSGDRRYHRQCFVCLHCNDPIDPQEQSFCYARLDGGSGPGGGNNGGGSGNGDNLDDNNNNGDDDIDEEHPFHRECFARHFGWICVVCEKALPMVTKITQSPHATAADADDGGGGGTIDINDDARNNNDGNGNGNANSNSSNNNSNNNGNNNGPSSPPAASTGGGIKSTKVEFLKHPFFENERMCPHHVGPVIQQVTRSYSHHGGQGNGDGGGGYDAWGGVRGRQGDRSSINTTTSEEVMGQIRRCAGCHRFEPLFAAPSKHFIDVGDMDTGRCVCLACCRTVVTSSDDVVPLWEKVIDFFEGPLGLLTPEGAPGSECAVTRRDLAEIPILVVGMEALNDNMKNEQDYRHHDDDNAAGGGGRRSSMSSGRNHHGSGQIMTRGLCLSERTGAGDDRGCRDVGITAIMCLSGLPADLTASILAHEATHAFVKLHPNFPFADPLPLRVEEGLCQLVAFLFLNDGLDNPASASGGEEERPPDPPGEGPPLSRQHPSTTTTSSTTTGNAGGENDVDDSQPSDEKLRQYFRFCIETDEGVYGEGFRQAARAYARLGMQELLYHVAVHRDFPPL